jgi:flagellar hook assembly protein FlgD
MRIAYDTLTGIYTQESEHLKLAISIYPNPFSKKTTITYTIPENHTRVSMAIYDVTGRRVKYLVDGIYNAGDVVLEWYGQDESNNRLPQGIYYLRMIVGKKAKSTKIVFIDR